MMSLVAYGSSDDDSEEEGEGLTIIQASKPALNTSNDGKVNETQAKCSIKESTHNFKLNSNGSRGDDAEQTSENTLNSSVPEEKDSVKTDTNGKTLFSKLPAPNTTTNLFISQDNLLPRKKSQQKGPVKILVPSLPEFDEEDEPPSKKKLQVQKSVTGTKLMSMLPPPKGFFPKESKPSLVPQSITRKPAAPVKPHVRAAPPVKKPTPKPVTSKPKSLIGYDDSGDESGSEETSTDFFSLTTDQSAPTAEITTNVFQPAQPMMSNIPYVEPTSYLEYPAEYSEASASSSSYIEPQADSGQDYIGFESKDLQLDDEAIQKLCGRKERLAAENVQFIDVSGDALIPDSKDWLTKQLTQERPSRSHRKGFGPSSQSKRKHQITYLAFQAKENELELQNQWANNRQSRRQTQSKYGF